MLPVTVPHTCRALVAMAAPPPVKEVLGVPLGSVNGGLAATEKLVATGDP